MPRMPLSGVRNSWLTVARKRDFATLAASARASASSRERVASIRPVMSMPARRDCGGAPSRETGISTKENQRGRPSTGRTCGLDAAGAVGVAHDAPVLQHRQVEGGADEVEGRAPEEAGEARIGEGDAPEGIALDDDLHRGLHEGAVALLALGDPGDAPVQVLDRRLFPARPRPAPEQGGEGERGGEEREDEGDVLQVHDEGSMTVSGGRGPAAERPRSWRIAGQIEGALAKGA